jgi:hypothetical protein
MVAILNQFSLTNPVQNTLCNYILKWDTDNWKPVNSDANIKFQTDPPVAEQPVNDQRWSVFSCQLSVFN